MASQDAPEWVSVHRLLPNTKEDAQPARGPTILAYHITGENDRLSPEENEIIRIAWEAVERRREAARKRGKQLQINGKVRENGYAVYKDYNQYMEKRKQRKQLDIATWDLARVRYEIRDTLLSKGWRTSPGHPETRFYPPELPQVIFKL